MEKRTLNLFINLIFYTCLFLWLCMTAYCLGSNIYVTVILYMILAPAIYMSTYKTFC